jgi:hypothetical protein
MNNETTHDKHIREAIGFQEASFARANSGAFKRLKIQSTQWQLDHDDAPRAKKQIQNPRS